MNLTNLKQLFEDEDAVSPVIGVILMVAITVILAAVIGTFVLGLGENVQDSAPQANFQFEYDAGTDGTLGTGTDDGVTITHTGGEDIDVDTLAVEGGNAAGGAWAHGGDNTINTGDSYSQSGVSLTTGETIRVIWTSPSGGTSSTIGQSTVPS